MPRLHQLLLISSAALLTAAAGWGLWHTWSRRDVWETAATGRGPDASAPRPIRRLDAWMPRDRYLAPTPTFPEDLLTVTLRLTRRHPDEQARACTAVQVVGDTGSFAFPEGWRGRAVESSERRAQLDGTLRRVTRALRRQMSAHGGDPEEIQGRILLVPPTGAQVPPEDVVQVLGLLMQLGVRDISYQGAPPKPG